MKTVYDKSTTKIILHWGNTESTPLKSSKRHRCPLLPIWFNIVLNTLTIPIRQKNKKNIELERKIQNYPYLFRDEPFYRRTKKRKKERKTSTRRHFEIINTFDKVKEYRIKIESLMALTCTNNKLNQKEIKSTIIQHRLPPKDA